MTLNGLFLVGALGEEPAEFFTDIFLVRDQHDDGDEREGGDFEVAQLAQEHHQGRERDGNHAAQGKGAHQRIDRQEDAGEDERNQGIVSENNAQRSGNAFAAVKMELDRPGMADDDGEHGRDGGIGAQTAFLRQGDGEHAFGDVRQQGGDEAPGPEDAADVAGADAAAAELADVLARAPTHPVIP